MPQMPFCLYLSASCFQLLIFISKLLLAAYIQGLVHSTFFVNDSFCSFSFSIVQKKIDFVHSQICCSFPSILFVSSLKNCQSSKIVRSKKSFGQLKKRSFCQKFVLKNVLKVSKLSFYKSSVKNCYFLFFRMMRPFFYPSFTFFRKILFFLKIVFVKKTMPISTYIWLYLLISTYIWLYMLISDYILLYLVISGYIWLYLVISAYICLYLLISAYICLYLVISAYICLYLVISGYIYLYLVISTYIWLYLLISAYIWLYLLIFGYIWLYLVISAYICLYLLISAYKWF